MVTLTPAWFEERWARARNAAGRRYTPNLDVALPIAEYFENVLQEATIFRRFADLGTQLQKATEGVNWGSMPQVSPEYEARLVELLAGLARGLQGLAELQGRAPVEISTTPTMAAATQVQELIEPVLERLREEQRAEGRQSGASETERRHEVMARIRRALRDIEDYLHNPATTVINNPRLLVLGSGGTGKTHLLCEMVRQRVERQLPAVLLLGQTFQTPFNDLLNLLGRYLQPQAPIDELLASLDAYARARSVRCLICIDALNEGHRTSWASGLPTLVAKVGQYPALALVVSCRTPFERLIIPDPANLGLQVVYHVGYPPEQQSDAVTKYFTAYDIPLPEVPLLEEEFSNPLFLKVFCEAMEKATVRAKHAQIRDLASGQRGMTYVLEQFVKQKDRSISKLLGSPPGLPWRLLKVDFASTLASHHTNAIPAEEARQISDSVQPANFPSGALLQALLNEDLLAEDISFRENGESEEVIRFTYQKFADHLIARHLLATQLDTKSTHAIKKSLQDPARLGFYFRDPETTLDQINVVQALMIEFPIRIGNHVELLDFLGWKEFPLRLCEAFLEGLYWREPRSIGRSTARWLTVLLRHPPIREQTLDVLTALAVKPRHPFKADRLDAFLLKQELVERDLFWTEYLRRRGRGGTAGRILAWAEHVAPRAPSQGFAQVYMTVLMWFLTSTQRAFRDRATHALFRLGLAHPETLFAETVRSLAVNDPYVPERMLAVAYGVTMALWRSPGRSAFHAKTLPAYARQLFRHIFAKGAKCGTTHILSREYAQRTIELALKRKPSLLTRSQKGLVTPPFAYGGIRQWGEAEERDEGRYRNGDAPLHMDFENYTLGRLVAGRANYDRQHADYRRVIRQILWRIYNLGYTLDTFSSIDQEIARSSWYNRGQEAGKTERYGKKYAWIAFYELAGFRQDCGLLPDGGLRISDADIDPSFPEPPDSPRVFAEQWVDERIPVRQWIRSGYRPPVEHALIVPSLCAHEGPWVVIDGFIHQANGDKTIFAFLNGLLVREGNTTAAMRILSAIEEPGNLRIPRPENEYYTYAGEIPWADTWRPQQERASIGAGGVELEVLLPVRGYSWEGYHSTENRLGGVNFPSKELGVALGLYVQIPKIALAEAESGRLAGVPLYWGDPFRNHESLLLLRQELLDRYLATHQLALLLFVWGERRANYQDGYNGRDLEGDFQFQEILHKQGFLYQRGNYVRFL